MKFRFKNIGPIKEAELELGDLTIIAGHNNTGKTYMVYTLYGFLKGLRDYVSKVLSPDYFYHHLSLFDGPSIEDIVSGLMSGNKVGWHADSEILCDEQVKVIKRAAAIYSNSGIAQVFNMPREVFSRASFEVDVVGGFDKNGTPGIPVPTGGILFLNYDGERIELSFDERQLLLFDRGDKVSALEESVRQVYALFLMQCFPFHYSYPFILSSARLSIPLFYKELDYVRSQIVRSIQQGEDSIGRASRYASPIHDNIDFVRSVPNFSKIDEQFHPWLLLSEIERMLGGHFERDEEFRFISKVGGEPLFDIPLHIASSSVCEMLNLYCYLRHEDMDHDAHFLMIDEPESHLDTANQIQFARLLAHLVNSGVKVLMTTHSDYIVREVNNLIMLSSPLEDGDQAKIKLGYRKDHQLTLDQVQAYVAEDGTLTMCNKDKFGVEISVFDETIDELNQTSEELASQIMMKARGE